MDIFPILLQATLLLVVIVVVAELVYKGKAPFLEGFTDSTHLTFWSSFTSPRSDIGPSQENPAYIRDPRYFNDYADVTRLGVPYDFCRMVAPSDDPTNFFFACAIAGTENLDSTRFRTPSVKDGFKISHDDYMRDINGDGRDDYCRILKLNDGSYQPVCAYAGDTGFDSKDRIDANPPDEIKTLLSFYQNCVIWLRLTGDILDSVKNTKIQTAGNITIDETPRRTHSDGLKLNGVDEFLRISDSPSLSLGSLVPLRSIRTWMCWVYFDEFTNNAKVFDFGNGAGKDNVFLGILGKGDGKGNTNEVRPDPCKPVELSTIPQGNSGAQPVPEMSPRELMETTDANVNDFLCNGFFKDRGDTEAKEAADGSLIQEPATGNATLLYEVWDKQARKMSIKINNVFPLKRWTHIAITTTSNDAFRPDIAVYVNGHTYYRKQSGWLPASSSMTNCYLGKSNWASSTSQYENRDELFNGSLFDFRAYTTSVSEKFIQESYSWGFSKLGIK